jgi:hypothetical protein
MCLTNNGVHANEQMKTKEKTTETKEEKKMTIVLLSSFNERQLAGMFLTRSTAIFFLFVFIFCHIDVVVFFFFLFCCFSSSSHWNNYR